MSYTGSYYDPEDPKGKRRKSRTSDYQSSDAGTVRPGGSPYTPEPESSEETGLSSSNLYDASSSDEFERTTRETRETSADGATPEPARQPQPTRNPLQNFLNDYLGNPATPTAEKVSMVTDLMEGTAAADTIAQAVGQITDHNEVVNTYQQENAKLQATLARLRKENGLDGLTGDGDPTRQKQLEMIEKLQKEERALRKELAKEKATVAGLNVTLDYAGNVVGDYRGKMVDYEQKSKNWIKSLETYIGTLTLENVNLKNQVEEIKNFVVSVRNTDTSRWQNMLKEEQEAKGRQRRAESGERLTYGTIDREMQDVNGGDTNMPDVPEPYIPTAATRVRRRLANVKPQAKRAGSPEVQIARPPECRSRMARACETYLKLVDKEGKVISPVRPPKQNVAKVLPRKRTRLAKGTDMVRRVEAVAQATRLPPLPKRIGPWYSTNPYDRRNDELLAKMMAKITITRDEHEDRGIQTELDLGSKLVSYYRPVEQIEGYIPRVKVYSGPSYLPPQPTPLSRDQRARWAKIADKWTLGPERAPKKQVRFAKDVDFEPRHVDQRPAPERKEPQTPQFRINWAHMLIILLTFLLWWSNLGSPEDPKQTWKMANRKPDEFAAKLRNTHEMDSRAVKIIEFEVGRFSDIDPGVIG
ncbi:hypothetical protein BJX68DRAFT_265973 [Aspergillus pseudodeflectus]|uniref:Uncharacterized protein n=1 Tax=Aspergillus pseudodeflectus TaxID=176178 RepID=A0ABR4KHI1_9EURO